MKGIFIPEIILNDERLNWNEKALLSLYYHYTVNGSVKCCLLTCDEIMREIGMSSTATLNRCKKHLKDLGLIKTNGGMKVWFCSTVYQNDKVKECKDENLVYQNDKVDYQNDKVDYQNDKVDYQNDKVVYQNDTHIYNKEKKNKNKKEPCETNFDFVIRMLGNGYQDKEIIDTIYSEFGNKINELDMEVCNLDAVIDSIKQTLKNKSYIKETKVKSNFKDVFFG